MIRLLPFILLTILFGCINGEPEFPDGPVEGFRPIYRDSAEVYNVTEESARNLKDPGKIYVYGNLLLINEKNEGVHVFNNADPSKPENLYFISIPGNIDVAVKNNVLYADNYKDLVLINITENGIQHKKRLKNALYDTHPSVPPDHGYFECVDPEKGTVIGWETTTIESPKCFY